MPYLADYECPQCGGIIRSSILHGQYGGTGRTPTLTAITITASVNHLGEVTAECQATTERLAEEIRLILTAHVGQAMDRMRETAAQASSPLERTSQLTCHAVKRTLDALPVIP